MIHESMPHYFENSVHEFQHFSIGKINICSRYRCPLVPIAETPAKLPTLLRQGIGDINYEATLSKLHVSPWVLPPEYGSMGLPELRENYTHSRRNNKRVDKPKLVSLNSHVMNPAIQNKTTFTQSRAYPLRGSSRLGGFISLPHTHTSDNASSHTKRTITTKIEAFLRYNVREHILYCITAFPRRRISARTYVIFHRKNVFSALFYDPIYFLLQLPIVSTQSKVLCLN